MGEVGGPPLVEPGSQGRGEEQGEEQHGAGVQVRCRVVGVQVSCRGAGVQRCKSAELQGCWIAPKVMRGGYLWLRLLCMSVQNLPLVTS